MNTPHRNIFSLVLAICLCLTLTSKADTVHYALEAHPDGTFQIFAEVFGTSSLGLHAVGVDIEPGSLTTIEHATPFLQFNQDFEPVGYGIPLAVNIPTLLYNAQFLFSPSNPPNDIFRMGQQPSSFAQEGYTQLDLGAGPVGEIRQPVWDKKLLIGEGTWLYNPADGLSTNDNQPLLMPRITATINTLGSTLLYQDPYVPETNNFYQAPSNITISNTFIPEPASLALLTLAGLTLTRRRN